jgi:hypothetical protein
MIAMVVVLPAPFAPSSAVVKPAATAAQSVDRDHLAIALDQILDLDRRPPPSRQSSSARACHNAAPRSDSPPHTR